MKSSPNASDDPTDRGVFEARYLAFLETVSHLRPRLHRYCARMTGSILDGEDVMQDALFQAYRKLDTFDDSRPLGPWLFRIAHNQCIDFLRRRRVRQTAESEAQIAAPDASAPVEPSGVGVGRAIEHLVLSLPAKERACVLLKDVFDYSLEEVADLVDSTPGGVKAALHRGRSKLAALPAGDRSATAAHGASGVRAVTSPEVVRLMHQYVDRFNRHDWDGLRELIAADARVGVADRYAGGIAGAPYFANYERRAARWRMAVGHVDGEPVVVVLQRSAADAWAPAAIARIELSSEHIPRITRIVDYTHCPWVTAAAESLVVADPMTV